MVVNSDDLYAPTRVERCGQAIASGRQLIFTNVEFIDADGRPAFGQQVASFKSALDAIGNYPTVSTAFIQMNRAISSGNLCFTPKLYNTVGQFINLKYCHDWDFVLSCTLETEPEYINEKLYYYRLHEDNSFKALLSKGQLETRTCLERYFNRVVSRAVANSALRAIIEAETLWEGLLSHSGSVIEQEWQRANDGMPPRAYIDE